MDAGSQRQDQQLWSRQMVALMSALPGKKDQDGSYLASVEGIGTCGQLSVRPHHVGGHRNVQGTARQSSAAPRAPARAMKKSWARRVAAGVPGDSGKRS